MACEIAYGCFIFQKLNKSKSIRFFLIFSALGCDLVTTTNITSFMGNYMPFTYRDCVSKGGEYALKTLPNVLVIGE